MRITPQIARVTIFHRYEPWRYSHVVRYTWSRNPQTDTGSTTELWLAKYGVTCDDPMRLKLSFTNVVLLKQNDLMNKGSIELYVMLDKDNKYSFFDIFDHDIKFLFTCDDFKFSFEKVQYDEM
jgi:hypothetical protein